MILSQSTRVATNSTESLSHQDEKIALIEQLLEIGTALSSSQDLAELLNLILTKSREITLSDAGSIYLLDRSDDTPKLLFKAAQNDSVSSVSLEEFAIPLTYKSLAGYVALTGKTLNLPDAYVLSPELPYQLDKSFDQAIQYRTRSALVLPMQDQHGEIIGVLQLINRKLQWETVITSDNALAATQPYSREEEEILRSLASQAAICIERNQLQQSIENLFEGFVRASVQVIEARDPTTSGHSERVAELTVRLAQEVSGVTQGTFQNIQFDRHQIQEIRYAALLHDFGKISIPESILIKRKKLYAEQLEVIRQRFAVAQRTLEMEAAQKKFHYLFESLNHQHLLGDLSCPYCHNLGGFDQDLQEKIADLNRYWDLILRLNEPQELQVFSDEVLTGLQEVANYHYRDVDGSTKPLISPEEMEQLLVPRGNLTHQERAAIEFHVTHTYEFLQRIPWTKHLQRVPEIAYAHHEKLDGSGYPRGLQHTQIPLQTQILTISDIYDALTASDRPYKRRLSLETALRILKAEAAQNHINAELVALFEQRQVYRVLGHSLEVSPSSAA